MRYLHTMLRVRNLDAALKFYADALGLKEVRRVDNDKAKFTLVFLCAPPKTRRYLPRPRDEARR
jgi:lactoylglutathione lyase